MFILGIIATFQILFIPGFIFFSLINIKTRPITYLMGILSTSLVINYLMVLILTTLHLYLQIILYIIVILELSFLVWKNQQYLNQNLGYYIQLSLSKIGNAFDSWVNNLKIRNNESALEHAMRMIFWISCIVLSVIAINWIWKLFIWNLGSVFNSYDTIVSWNKWAIYWANNTFPNSTAHYPQLLPINWSLIYVMIGNTTIQFFAQAIMPLFTFFILLMAVDLAFAKKNPGYFLGSFIIFLVLKKFLGSFLIEGLADMPSAFLSFSAIYFLLISISDLNDIEKQKKFSLLMAISVSGCAVTKQGGLLFLFMFLVVYLIYFFRPAFKTDPIHTKKGLLLFLSVCFLIVVPWYLYKQILIWKGLEPSEIRTIVSDTALAFNNVHLWDRFVEIAGLLGKYFYLLLLLIPLSFLSDPVLRGIFFVIVIPFFISWGSFASYDFRNLAIALPIFGICSGSGINTLISFGLKLIRKINFEKIRIKYLFMLLLVIFFVAGFFFPNSLLQQKQTELTMNTFSPEINQKIISEVSESKRDFVIITPYPVDNLPGLFEKRIRVSFMSYPDYQLTMERVSKDKDIYLLIPKYSDTQIMTEIQSKIDSGDFSLIFEDTSWIHYLFIKVINRQ